MMRQRISMIVVIVLGMFALAGWMTPQAGSPTANAAPDARNPAGAQQQTEKLKQLENQLEKDRAAVHEAIDKYGYDSDQTDAAREQLFRDRNQYRQLRRSLAGSGQLERSPNNRWFRGPAGRDGNFGPRGRGMMRGADRHGCPCCAW